jgi:hypothetical protein
MHQLNKLEELFHALGDATTRLRILRVLMASELCVCNPHDVPGTLVAGEPPCCAPMATRPRQ